jgi:hypothetical protein
MLWIGKQKMWESRRLKMTWVRFLVSVLALGMLIGCASSMNHVKLGMTKDEVVGALGPPSSTSGIYNMEYLKYQLCTDWIFTDRYFVRLTDGKVDAFGRVGDFNMGY